MLPDQLKLDRLIGANVRQIAVEPPSQGDRKGRSYYTTNRPAKPVYSRGGACPQYISKKRPSRFVILSAAKDLSPDRDPSLRSG